MSNDNIISKTELLEDFVRVYNKYKNETNLDSMPRKYYREHGKYLDKIFEEVFGTYKKFKKAGLAYSNSINESTVDEKQLNESEFNPVDDDSAVFRTIVTKDRITDIPKLLESFGVDLDIWQVEKPHIKKYDGYIKNADKEVEIVELFSIEIYLRKKILETPKIKVPKPIEFNFELVKPSGIKKEKENNVKKALIIGDAHTGFLRDITTGKLHTPFHSTSTMDLILQLSEKMQPDKILMVGDMLDIAEAGKYLKRPEFYFTLQPAINIFGYFLALLRQKNPDAEIAYLQGNHGARIDKFIYQHGLFAYNLKAYGENVPLLSLRKILNLDKINVKLYDDYPKSEYWLNDKLKVVHGEYLNMNSLLNTTKVSIIQGHLHRGEIVQKTTHYRDGEEFVMVASIPGMCHIDGRVPSKMYKNNWQEGCGYVEYDKTDFTFHNIIFSNKKCIFNGQTFKGIGKVFKDKKLFSF